MHYRIFGSGEPLIILHGLFGCWDNWYPVAKDLSQRFGVCVPDLRNHGRSFHSARFDYDVMADDIRRLMDEIGLTRASLLGHSMGGKAAMRVAARFPRRIARLIIVDITYKACRPIYAEAIDALCRLDLGSLTRLKDAEQRLRPAIPDPTVRMFLLKNLEHTRDNGYRWKVNLDSIRRNQAEICGPVKVRRLLTPSLFVRGGKSEYIRDSDWPEIKTIFPRAELVTLAHAGHWAHADDKDGFLKTVKEFMARSRGIGSPGDGFTSLDCIC
ncbi:MAG: alpha/beta fold hydrolase [Hyphomicrobiales bacterium]